MQTRYYLKNSSRLVALLCCFAAAATSGCMHAPALDDGVMLGKHLVEQEKDYDRAIQELEKIVATNPNATPLTWYWLGRARFHKSLYPQAAQAFERSLGDKGMSRVHKEGAYDFLGWAYYHSRAYQKAVAAFDNAMAWSRYTLGGPKSRMSSLCGRGWSRYYTGDFQGALQDLNQALPLVPENNPGLRRFCYQGLAYTHLALGNDDGSLASIEKAHASQNYDKNFDLALIYLVQGRKEEAFRHWGGAGSAGVFVQDYQEGGVAGARVAKVAPNEPAAAAGLMPGDIIRAVDGQPVTKGSDFVFRIKGFEPGKSVKIDLLRKNSPLQKTLIVGSAEALIAQQPLIAPVLKVRPIAIASATPPAPPSQEPSTDQPALQLPSEPSSSDQPAPPPPPEPAASPQPVNQGPVIAIEAVSVTPQEVTGGELFEAAIDLYAENPQDKSSKIAVTFHYAISRDGKVLKQFDPETFKVPNGETETITKKIRAAKAKGHYTVDIRFELEGKEAQQSAGFSIK